MIRRPLWPVFLCSSAVRHLEGYLAGILLCCSACQAHRGGPPVWGPTLRSAHPALKGAPWVESYSVVQCGRHLMGQPLYCSTNNAGVWGERETMVMAPPLPWDSAVLPCFHGCLAFLHRHFPPQCHIPLIHLSAVNSSPHPGIIPQSLNSSCQLLRLPGNLHPCPGYVWLWQGLSDSHSIYAVSLSVLNVFSSESDNCLDVGIGLLL